MTKNAKGHYGGYRVTRQGSDKRNPSVTAPRTKTVFIGAACWGLLPFKRAGRIIRRLYLGAA